MYHVPKLVDLTITNILLSSRSVCVNHLKIALQERLPPVFVEKICSAKQRIQDIASAVISRHFKYVFRTTLRHTGQNDKKCPICFGNVIRIFLAPNYLVDDLDTKLFELHTVAEEQLTMRCALLVHGWFFT